MTAHHAPSEKDKCGGPGRITWSAEHGIEMVEYALLAALLLGLLVAIIPAFPNAFVSAYTAINDAIADALGP